MGNVKSRNDFDKTNRKISRNLSQPQLLPPSLLSLSSGQCNHQHQQQQQPVPEGEDEWTATTTTRIEAVNTATTSTTTNSVGGLLVEVDVETSNDSSKTKTKHNNKAKEDPQQIRRRRLQRQQKAADSSAACAVALTEPQQQQQQQRHHHQQKQQQQQSLQQQQHRLKQASSFWSLGSLNWNLSYSGRNSYKQRQKSSRKSFSTLQYQRRSKTQWHRPLTNAIFRSHFKESSRNGEFNIDRLVAKGAFGVVFRVIDKNSIKQTETQQQEQHQQTAQHLITDNLSVTTTPVYALKVLKKSKIISENSVQQIKDEADIQKLCGHHPFIVKQIDLWQNRYNLHILSEFVPNGELFSKISTFSLNLIRVYLAEIALALDFLHNAGIIYRDAKPENILLTADYHLKLTDFGLSKWLKFGLTTKTICGTFQYMAPEILRGEPYTHSVDWWSLGIIVCQMFVKKSPDIRQFITVTLPPHLQSNDQVDNAALLRDKDTEVTERKLMSTQEFLPEEVQHLPHEGRDVLQRLLEFDGQRRLHSVRALQRIAMYKDFKVESRYIQKIRPLDIIAADNITLYNDEDQSPENSFSATNAFQNF